MSEAISKSVIGLASRHTNRLAFENMQTAIKRIHHPAPALSVQEAVPMALSLTAADSMPEATIKAGTRKLAEIRSED